MFNKTLGGLLLCGMFSYAQPAPGVQGAQSAALSNIGSVINGIWGISANPAGTASASHPAGTDSAANAELSFTFERPFLLKELDTRAAAAIIRLGRPVAGLALQSFGFELYKQQRITLSCARALSEKFLLGIAFHYQNLLIPGFEHEQAFSVSIGMQYRIFPGLITGLYISNPNAAGFSGRLGVPIPRIIALGLSYHFSGKLRAMAELKNVQNAPASLHTGFAYQVHPRLALRIGLSTAPFRQYGGLGLHWKQIRLDLAASSHQRLGFTPQITLSYAFH